MHLLHHSRRVARLPDFRGHLGGLGAAHCSGLVSRSLRRRYAACKHADEQYRRRDGLDQIGHEVQRRENDSCHPTTTAVRPASRAPEVTRSRREGVGGRPLGKSALDGRGEVRYYTIDGTTTATASWVRAAAIVRTQSAVGGITEHREDVDDPTVEMEWSQRLDRRTWRQSPQTARGVTTLALRPLRGFAPLVQL